jgi:Primase C terminal 1 (PriCT-1)
MRKFHLVDFAAHYQKGFRNHVVTIADVPALMESFDRYGCYATYFFFSDEVLTYMSAQAKESRPSISGYEGKVWSPFFPIDLDHPAVDPALAAARRLASLFLDSWRIDPRGLQIYFSGSKGFHLMLDARLFGKVVPSKDLPLIFDSMRRHLARELPEPLRETLDLAIRDRVRLWRLPNTIHEKSQHYKIILSAEELKDLDASEIRMLARHMRPLKQTDESGFVSNVAVERNAAVGGLFQRIGRQVRRITRRPFNYRFRRPDDLARIEFPCAGMQAIWNSQIESGQRNNCAIRLASDLRLLGLNADEATGKLLEWNEKNQIDLPAGEIHSVVRSAYQRRHPYRYSCSDVILRQFCKLPDLESCRRHIVAYSEPNRNTKSE